MEKKTNDIKILAFDTSCDDTSVAVLCDNKVLSNVVSSQTEIHKKWGGVVPMIARHAHEENIEPTMMEALKRAHLKIEDIDYLAVTQGPGLAIDLEVSINFVKRLSKEYGISVIPVNHMHGHLLSGLALNSKGKFLGSLNIANEKVRDDSEILDKIFPALGLLVSGGHTELIYVEDIGKYKKIGDTLDDAAGEAFDKVGRMLNFGYPGGPIVSEFAKKGENKHFGLPVPMKFSKDLNFSYSGLKTASLYKIEALRKEYKHDNEWAYDFCTEFVDVLIESIVVKIKSALKEHPDCKSIMVGGGVINSSQLVNAIIKFAKENSINYIIPSKKLRSDNAGMIGIAAYYHLYQGLKTLNPIQSQDLDRDPTLDIE